MLFVTATVLASPRVQLLQNPVFLCALQVAVLMLAFAGRLPALHVMTRLTAGETRGLRRPIFAPTWALTALVVLQRACAGAATRLLGAGMQIRLLAASA